MMNQLTASSPGPATSPIQPVMNSKLSIGGLETGTTNCGDIDNKFDEDNHEQVTTQLKTESPALYGKVPCRDIIGVAQDLFNSGSSPLLDELNEKNKTTYAFALNVVLDGIQSNAVLEMEGVTIQQDLEHLRNDGVDKNETYRNSTPNKLHWSILLWRASCIHYCSKGSDKKYTYCMTIVACAIDTNLWQRFCDDNIDDSMLRSITPEI